MLIRVYDGNRSRIQASGTQVREAIRRERHSPSRTALGVRRVTEAMLYSF